MKCGWRNRQREIKILELYSADGNYRMAVDWMHYQFTIYNSTDASFESLGIEKNLITENAKHFSCKHCKRQIAVKAYPFTRNVSCENCHTLYNISNGSLELIKSQGEHKKPLPDLPIGSFGTIEKIKYEVIGFSLKEEVNQYHARWKEYVLYNRIHGFSFLSEYKGHWVFLKEMKLPPVIGRFNDHDFSFGSKHFQLYNAYKYKVIFSSGEHPYDLETAEKYYNREYISPPIVLTSESKDTETNWFKGRYVDDVNELAQFTFSFGKPQKIGIGSLETTGFYDKSKYFKLTLFFAALFLGIHLLLSAGKENRIILEQSFFFADSVNKKTIIDSSFTFGKANSNLKIEFSAPLVDSWLELSGSLINKETGEEFSFSKGLEYYSGVEDGSNWSEGSQDETTFLSGIPGGNYVLHIDADRDSGAIIKFSNVNLKLTYDVRTDRNFWFPIGILLLIAIIQHLVYSYYDSQRWEDSPYSKYSYES